MSNLAGPKVAGSANPMLRAPSWDFSYLGIATDFTVAFWDPVKSLKLQKLLKKAVGKHSLITVSHLRSSWLSTATCLQHSQQDTAPSPLIGTSIVRSSHPPRSFGQNLYFVVLVPATVTIASQLPSMLCSRWTKHFLSSCDAGRQKASLLPESTKWWSQQ